MLVSVCLGLVVFRVMWWYCVLIREIVVMIL